MRLVLPLWLHLPHVFQVDVPRVSLEPDDKLLEIHRSTVVVVDLLPEEGEPLHRDVPAVLGAEDLHQQYPKFLLLDGAAPILVNVMESVVQNLDVDVRELVLPSNAPEHDRLAVDAERLQREGLGDVGFRLLRVSNPCRMARHALPEKSATRLDLRHEEFQRTDNLQSLDRAPIVDDVKLPPTSLRRPILLSFDPHEVVQSDDARVVLVEMPEEGRQVFHPSP
mmetsp:Transcript_29547/g.78690  ORF Transcript_29547/g.78690 Transcript_29547/m.78690 type:complete len:223 (-) Transcript_29547:369-1037(-)